MQAPELIDLAIAILVIGLPATLQLTFFGLAFGFAIGLTLALLQVYGTKEMGWISTGYERILRGIPLLVLIYIFTFGVPGIFWFVEPLQRPIFGVFFALGLRSGAYQSQIIRGAILSIGEGQIIAARSLGMTGLQIQLYVVLPQAFRIALPGFSNEYAVVIKDSSFASAVGVFELLKITNNITSNRPELWLPYLLFITVIYFIFTYPVTRYFGKRAELGILEFDRGG